MSSSVSTPSVPVSVDTTVEQTATVAAPAKITYTELLNNLKLIVEVPVKDLSITINRLHKQFKIYEKKITKMENNDAKPKKPKVIGENTGVNKKKNVSAEMLAFVGVEPNTQLSRSEVMKSIYKYLKDSGLQNPENKKEYFLDEKMKTIMNGTHNPETGKWHILGTEIMKELSKHFLADTPAPVAPAPAPAAAPAVEATEPEKPVAPKPAVAKPTATAASAAPKPVAKPAVAGKK
jgi:chromatin remodeling complex protein RSC6